MPKNDKIDMTPDELEQLEREAEQYEMMLEGERLCREDRIEHELERLLAMC